MLKQLAAMAVIPPSPNIRACNTGPPSLILPLPRVPELFYYRCSHCVAMLPPGIGTLNIMITKENAAEREAGNLP